MIYENVSRINSFFTYFIISLIMKILTQAPINYK